MQNNSPAILEQMLLLERRRILQQRDLLQQHLPAPAPAIPGSLNWPAFAAKFPLSSTLLMGSGTHQDLAAATAGSTAPATVTPPTRQVNPDILRELQQNLVDGGSSTVGSESLRRLISQLSMGASPDPARLDAPLTSASVSSFNSSSIGALPTTHEELLSQLFATKLSSAASRADLGALLSPNRQQQQQQMGASVATNVAAGRKRSAGKLQATAASEGDKCLAKKLRRAAQPPQRPERTATKVIDSATAELKERAEAARLIASLAYPPSNTKRKFPLPSEQGSEMAPIAPKMKHFRQAWDNVKSKSLRKEIFLRKLHAGTLLKELK